MIAGYLESITDGNAFVREAEQISNTKPILLMKSGGTAAGAKAASSHTGSLAGGETGYEAASSGPGSSAANRSNSSSTLPRRSPISRCRPGTGWRSSPTPAVPASWRPTRSNGRGLDFAKLSQATKDKLAEKLPAAANIHNPVDVLGDALADRYEFALDMVLDDPNVDIVLVLLTPAGHDRVPTRRPRRSCGW